jgi:FAD/FMN-containing dehydrogenase
LRADLAKIVGSENVLAGDTRRYLYDSTETRALGGRADAVVTPGSTEEVAGVLAWCYAHDVALVPRGGGTGYAGGAVPLGGVVLSLERLNRVRSFAPLLWRMEVEAGVTTAGVRGLARENGLLFPPDPGATEQSQIGGNIATNAGGPHAFKYGVTGAWVTGLEAVIPPGDVVTSGGPLRKDVAGYDLKSLLVGSEGTLGVVTAAWLRLVPAPEAAFPVVAFYTGVGAGCGAIERVVGSGLQASALEYFDAGALAAAGSAFPGDVPAGADFMVIAEADGSAEEAARLRDEIVAALGEDALDVALPAAAELWRWREGMAFAAIAQRGGKIGEDIAVPLERLGEAIEESTAIARRNGLDSASWGHAGDGNLHTNFLVSLDDADELARAARGAEEMFDLALRLGGSVSGEHGLGLLKRDHARWPARMLALQLAIKEVFDPKGLLNPGKKFPPAGQAGSFAAGAPTRL